MQKKSIEKFQNEVYSFYANYRRDLPWRNTKDGYRILVSEIMLQQTQVDRVLPKYLSFIETFPSFDVLANASLRDVLAHWQGLGYNRRGKYLWETATIVSKQFLCVLPHEEHVLALSPINFKRT